MASPKARVLVVDDLEANRTLLEARLSMMGYTVEQAEDGASALAAIEATPPDLVLLDIAMPGMDGMEVLRRMNESGAIRSVPVLVVSGLDETERVIQCIKLGADDYLAKPFAADLLTARVNSSLERKRLRDEVHRYNIHLEELVNEQVIQISRAHWTMIFSMAKLADSRDPETGEHIERMREYCRILALELSATHKFTQEIDETFVARIYAASPLHDIGKVGVPDRVLLKPGKLDPDEFELIKKHTTIGADALRAVTREYPDNELIEMGIQITESHHERWDGKGYPLGLAGDDIPLASRILAVGDVYDALTSTRCYKEAFSHEKSRDIIAADAGTHFDAHIVEAFLKCEDAFIAVRASMTDSKKQLLT